MTTVFLIFLSKQCDHRLFRIPSLNKTLLKNSPTISEGSNPWAGGGRTLHDFENSIPSHKLVIIIRD